MAFGIVSPFQNLKVYLAQKDNRKIDEDGNKSNRMVMLKHCGIILLTSISRQKAFG